MANYDFSNLLSFLAPKTSSALNQITQNYQQSQRTSSGSSTPSSTTNSGVKYTTPGASDPAYKAAVASTTPNY